MTLTGGKRKVNKSLKAWVAFVKKVQKEEKLNYKDAIHRAKQRKDKGEKWMKGGENTTTMTEETDMDMDMDNEVEEMVEEPDMNTGDEMVEDIDIEVEGGRRRRSTMRRMRRGRSRARTARRGRSRARGRSRSRSRY